MTRSPEVILLVLFAAVVTAATFRRAHSRRTAAVQQRDDASEEELAEEDEDLAGIAHAWIDQPIRASEILALRSLGERPPLAGTPPFLAVFTANRTSLPTQFNDVVEFDRLFREMGDDRIGSVFVMLEEDRDQAERFLLAHELDVPALIGPSPALEEQLTDSTDLAPRGPAIMTRRFREQLVILNTGSGRAVVRALLTDSRPPIPLASKRALIERVLRR